MKDLLNHVIDYLASRKVQYGEARICDEHQQMLNTRNQVPMNIVDSQSSGIGIRVLINSGWGFSASPDLTRDGVLKTADNAIEIARASATTLREPTVFADEESRQIVWATPVTIDPFAVAINDKIGFLLSITSDLLKHQGVQKAIAYMNLSREHKFFMNTQRTFTDQCLVRVFAGFSAIATGPEGFESRSYAMTPLNAGYERILQEPFREHIPRVAEEVVAKLKSRICPQETADLILLPSHTALTIHETIGHATELDRVMGWEADMAGTSFATIDKFQRLRYGSEIFNVTGDRTMEFGRASVPVDDEGVMTGRWHIIRNGILSGYATTRGTAHFIGEKRSRGCAYADSWHSWPILRMPNVSIEPGPPGAPSFDDLLADSNNAILVDGTGSFSIDHQRINFQFGGDCAWRIRHGKKAEILRRFTYQSHNPVFWNSVDAICSPEEWLPHGVVSCGKGQPMQLAQLTHGSAPLRVRNVAIGKAQI